MVLVRREIGSLSLIGRGNLMSGCASMRMFIVSQWDLETFESKGVSQLVNRPGFCP